MDLEKYRPTTTGKKWGLGLLILSVMGIFSGFSFIFESSLEAGATTVISYLIIGAIGYYLLTSKKAAQKAQAKEEERKANRELNIKRELEFLKSASGAKASISYNKLRLLVLANKEPDVEKKIDELLESINFDKSRVESKMLGSVRGKSGRIIHIYKEWVIVGDSGWDFDISTRGDVSVGGSVTFDSRNVRQDMRTATLYLATQEWSQAFKIDPDHADEARRIINQLMAIIDELKPKGVTAADVQASMEQLVNKSGKSQAERLEELSNLRYQRLLSDDEFESAKKKILEI